MIYCGDSLAAEAASAASWEAAKVMETYQQDYEDVENEGSVVVAKMGNYFIFSEIP